MPTFVKDNVDVAGMSTVRGADAWTSLPAHLDSELAKLGWAGGTRPGASAASPVP